MLSHEEIDFIRANEKADTAALLLGYAKKGAPAAPGKEINVPLCVKCIEARRRLRTKLPLWYENPGLVYPLPVPVEQCSSQAAALYKQAIVKNLLCPAVENNKPDIADLTGGLGVDSFFLSQVAGTLYYYERNPELCRAAEYNFSLLGARNILINNTVIEKGGREPAGKNISLVYLDPARRNRFNSKVISLRDYEPDLLELKEDLFKVAPYILVKVSPMADIRFHLDLLPETIEIHVVAVDNECKETLFLLSGQQKNDQKNVSSAEPLIKAVNLRTSSAADRKNKTTHVSGKVTPESAESFCFYFSEEQKAVPLWAKEAETYLYEPNKAILKAGAFKLTAVRTRLKKLAPSTHLYTGDAVVPFPGKRFKIIGVRDFNKKEIKQLGRDFPKAEISCRNFPLTTSGLRQAARISEGGEVHIFAVTLEDDSRKLVIAVLDKAV